MLYLIIRILFFRNNILKPLCQCHGTQYDGTTIVLFSREAENDELQKSLGFL